MKLEKEALMNDKFDYERFIANSSQIAKNFADIGEKVRKGIEHIVESIDYEKLRTFAVNIEYIVNGLPDELLLLQKKLMTRGWYSISEMNLTQLIDVLEMEDEKIEVIMTDFVEQNQVEFIERAYCLFDNRKKIIESAYKAHLEGEYELSIPIFLIQADGITKEMFGESLYTKSKGSLRLSTEYDRLINEFGEDKEHEIVLSPLSQITSINMNTEEYEEYRKYDKFFSPLNRHGIIHGMNLNYSTKANSLRCILLIEFLNEVKSKYIDKDPNSNTT